MLLGIFENGMCPPLNLKVRNTVKKRALSPWMSLWDTAIDNEFLVRGIVASCVKQNAIVFNTIDICFSQDSAMIGWYLRTHHSLMMASSHGVQRQRFGLEYLD